MKHKIGVLGAGTWGMALARMLTVSGNEVQVWSALPAEVDSLSTTRVHPNLPGMKIPAELQFTKSIEEVCTGKDVLLFAVPSVFVRSTTAKARPYIPDGQILVDVAKGMEPDTLYTMTEVIADELNREGGPKGVKLVALSGPTHAEEVALDMPTTAKIWKITLAMLLAAMTVALMWPSTAVCAACATPHSRPRSLLFFLPRRAAGAAEREVGFRRGVELVLVAMH